MRCLSPLLLVLVACATPAEPARTPLHSRVGVPSGMTGEHLNMRCEQCHASGFFGGTADTVRPNAKALPN